MTAPAAAGAPRCLGVPETEADWFDLVATSPRHAAAMTICKGCPIARPCELHGHEEDGYGATIDGLPAGIYGGRTVAQRAARRAVDPAARAAYDRGRARHRAEATEHRRQEATA